MNIRIGLLPLYLKLYDDRFAEHRPGMDAFVAQIAAAFREQGVAVESCPVCRVAPEFAKAVKGFEKAGVDALVTLHLAYSPSLEAAAALAGTALPIIVLDTSPTFDFGPTQDPAEIMGNHGIHGVQDMCNLLLRRGKPFVIEAGHWEKSDVLPRVCRHLRGARIAQAFRTARIGTLGTPFQGMGDFQISTAEWKATGVTTVSATPAALRPFAKALTAADIAREAAADRQRFVTKGLTPEAHERSIRTCLTVRRWMAAEKLNGFTFNFFQVDRHWPIPTLPFLEASKAMARGQGFGGEGDVLTAALVAALAAGYPETTFTEMFCPDWKGNRVFLSHMGEMNPDLVIGKAVLAERKLTFINTGDPVAALGCFKAGKAWWVNLAPAAGNRLRLITAPVTMVNPGRKDRMAATIHGWFTADDLGINDFLAGYSRLGGTHHAALVYGAEEAALQSFAAFTGCEYARVR